MWFGWPGRRISGVPADLPPPDRFLAHSDLGSGLGRCRQRRILPAMGLLTQKETARKLG